MHTAQQLFSQAPQRISNNSYNGQINSIFLPPVLSCSGKETTVFGEGRYFCWEPCQGRSPRSGRSGIGRTTFHLYKLKLDELHTFDCGFELNCTCKPVVNRRGPRINMATANFPSAPHQPARLSFPKRSFGKKAVALRAFQASWFSMWKWIHYDETNDRAYCFYCVKGFKEGKLKAPNADPAFVSAYKDYRVSD